MRSLAASFYYIIVSIEESKNLVNMNVEELHASLKADEMGLEKRNSESEKVVEQALRARFTKKFGREKEKRRNNLTNDEKSCNNSMNHSN